MTQELNEKEYWNSTHFNSNRLVGISIKTTGSDSRLHEMVQLCVFPLTSRLELSKELFPFYMDLKPMKRSAKVELGKGYLSSKKYNELLTNDSLNTPQHAAELFDKWIERLKLDENKRLLPLCHNWAFQRPFIRNWLGPVSFTDYFSHEYRDLMSVALFSNDYSDTHSFPFLYPKVNLSSLASTLNVEFNKYDETILHVKAITEIYRKMLQKILPTI